MMDGERVYFWGMGRATSTVWMVAPMRRRVLREKLLRSAYREISLQIFAILSVVNERL